MKTMAKAVLLFTVLIQCILLCYSRSIPQPQPQPGEALFDVTEYGASGDGVTDDAEAFKSAWKDACQSRAPASTMYVPVGKTFLLRPVIFAGGCKSENVTLQIDGTLIAVEDPFDWGCKKKKCPPWIVIRKVDGLSIHGTGMINGRGSQWWDRSLCKHKKIGCVKKPTGFIIHNCNNVRLSSLMFKDSLQMHIAFERSTDVRISDITVRAPGHSPNTDGIHIQHSQNVIIEESTIRTGDDCISIGDGSANLDISRIVCGPGHGISIGSLGKHGSYETVENVRARDVHFTGTSNGVRIKSWQGGSGYARNIIFERITTRNSSHPIIIDQYYCDHHKCKNQTSAVEISNVRYKDIVGTSQKRMAVKLACSETYPCRNIYMEDIDLAHTEKGKKTYSQCSNIVEGIRSGTVVPDVPCLVEVFESPATATNSTSSYFNLR